jgi:hypothetical protein
VRVSAPSIPWSSAATRYWPRIIVLVFQLSESVEPLMPTVPGTSVQLLPASSARPSPSASNQ